MRNKFPENWTSVSRLTHTLPHPHPHPSPFRSRFILRRWTNLVGEGIEDVQISEGSGGWIRHGAEGPSVQHRRGVLHRLGLLDSLPRHLQGMKETKRIINKENIPIRNCFAIELFRSNRGLPTSLDYLLSLLQIWSLRREFCCFELGDRVG